MDEKTEAERFLELQEWISTGQARHWRVEAHVSQALVARTVGVDIATVLRWEKGKRIPRGRNAREYHRFLERLSVHGGA